MRTVGSGVFYAIRGNGYVTLHQMTKAMPIHKTQIHSLVRDVP
jgi:hypothetical protein